MARFLIGTVPAVGHVNPLVPIAQQLVQRGHEVRWYTGQRFRERVEATGARFVPMRIARDYDDREIDDVFPGRKRLRGLAQFKWDIKHLFLDAAIGQVADLKETLRSFPADVLVTDTGFTGGAVLSELVGLPWAGVNPSALTLNSRDTAPFGLGLQASSSVLGRARNRTLSWLFNHILFRDVVKYTNKVRGELGLPRSARSLFDQATSPYLVLQGTSESFEYPRSDLPPQVHFVGPFLPTPPSAWTPPAWWNDLKADRPVVHVTQGTISTNADMLIQPTLQALAGENVLVVATTGGKPIETLKLGQLPPNVRLEVFIPHHYLLPHVDVMITNGGYNGVQIALANGVPLVAAGRTEEKPEVCARVEWAGVGINLRTDKPSPEKIRVAVKRILADARYKERARGIAIDFGKHNAPAEASMLLERLAATKQPVLRKDVPYPTHGSGDSAAPAQ